MRGEEKEGVMRCGKNIEVNVEERCEERGRVRGRVRGKEGSEREEKFVSPVS